MEFLTSLDLVSILIFLVGGLFLLLFILLYLQLKSVTRINRMTYPAYEDVIKKAQNKAYEIIHDASEEAREIRTKAELEGIESVSKGNIEVKKLEEKYEESLKELVEYNENMLEDFANEASEWNESQTEELEKIADKNREKLEAYTSELDIMYDEFSEYLTNSIEESVSSLEGRIKEIENRINNSFNSIEKVSSGINEDFVNQINGLSERLEDVFERLEIESVGNVKEKINKKFEEMSKGIDSYEENWKDILDKNAFDIVARVSKIALQKGLSQKDQAELVKKALIEAKKEGLFG